jgi:uncharacterized repeat protein (TIGR01451 family)
MKTSHLINWSLRAARACREFSPSLFRATLLLTLLVFLPDMQSAPPPAGTSIGNQASATYTDSSNTPRTATSNVAITIVQQVAAFTLTTDGQARFAPPGGQVVYPHTLRNTGNGTDTFTLSVVNAPSGDNFDLNSLALFADANGDGLPDNSTPITSTGPLPAGGTFQFVAVGIVPGSATAPQTAIARVTAVGTATASPAAMQTNSNTTTVTADAVVGVTKSISASSGAPGSGPYTITLLYNNTGNNTATNLDLFDVLPSGMTYVTNSARWSVLGATPLTDINADTQGSAPDTIAYDWNITVAGRVTARISRVQPGQSGTLTFQVNIAAGAPSGAINNTATYSYDPGTGTPVGPFTGNTVTFDVTTTASLTLTGQTIPNAPAGSTVSFTNVVRNTGNATDTFDISLSNSNFPAGTTFTLYQSDGNTPLVDSSGNGVPDTGPLATNATYNVVVKATLPPGASGSGVNYTVIKTATSKNNPAVTASANDVLQNVGAATVDLSNGAVGGAGVGPEASAVVTNTVNPAATTRFTLFVTNTSVLADTYNLAASTDSSFGSLTLPSGWSVVFRDTSEAIVTTTGPVNPGAAKQIYADVTVPAGNAPGTTDIYFRSLSPTTSATDRLHDAVRVNTIRNLTLAPNNNGQVFPGGTVVYSHLLVNNGNVTEGDGTNSSIGLSLTNSLAPNGWNSLIYYDANNNGAIDGGDTVVTNLAFLSAGGIGLAPGETVRLLVKVNAAPSAPIGAQDVATLSATVVNVNLATTAPTISAVTDTSTVIAGDLTLVKEQALDANNDGSPDGAYATADITTGALPGKSIRYRIIVTNTGTAPAVSVKVFDTTPAFTVYSTNGPAVTTLGTVTAPSGAVAGSLIFDVGTLAPGQSATNTFGVVIQQ